MRRAIGTTPRRTRHCSRASYHAITNQANQANQALHNTAPALRLVRPMQLCSTSETSHPSATQYLKMLGQSWPVYPSETIRVSMRCPLLIHETIDNRFLPFVSPSFGIARLSAKINSPNPTLAIYSSEKALIQRYDLMLQINTLFVNPTRRMRLIGGVLSLLKNSAVTSQTRLR